ACGPFDVTFSVWDLDAVGSGRGGISRQERALLRKRSGISIYRDGFRIAPYGDAGDDWLELNQRRVNNPTMRVSTNQLIGAVEITDRADPGLRDRTSREGLLVSQAFQDLKLLVIAALSQLEEQRFAARKATTSDERVVSDDPVLRHLELAEGASG